MNPLASASAPPPPPPYQTYIEEENPVSQEYVSRQFLSQHFWPIGLQNNVLNSCRKFPIRFMIVDDSGTLKRFQKERRLFYAKINV